MSKTKGSISGLEIQPGWTIESDGEGLLTSRVVFRARKGASPPGSKAAHPKDGRLQCYKSSYTEDASWCTITADYVGLENGPTKTKFTADFSSQSHSIKAHPNFLKATFGTSKPFKELGWDSERQLFSEDSQEAEENGLVGVTNWLAPDQTITGYFYTDDQGAIQSWVDGVGKIFDVGAGGEVTIRSDYKPISAKHTGRVLLTGVSYESYAHLWKIMFTARAASGGWNELIYEKSGE